MLVHFASSSAYIWSTLKGRTKPNRVTFFLWAVAPFIATAAALNADVGWAVIPVFMIGFMPCLIFLASFVNPNAYWKLGTFDYVCGALSVLALVLWLVTSNPILAIALALLADFAAAIPTIIKAWRFPETEHFGAYAGATFNNALVFTYAPVYTFATIAFPAYTVALCLFILVGIYRKKIRATLRF